MSDATPAGIPAAPRTWTSNDLARTVDHTLLRPEATDAQVAALVAEAAELGTYSVCVSPSRLPVEVPDGLVICTVVGFPSGAQAADVKASEAHQAVQDGAGEVDMVVDLGALLAGDWDQVESDVRAVRAACDDALLKVILETGSASRPAVASATPRPLSRCWTPVPPGSGCPAPERFSMTWMSRKMTRSDQRVPLTLSVPPVEGYARATNGRTRP